MPARKSKTAARDRDELRSVYQARRPACEEALAGLYREVRALLETHGYTPTIKYRVKRFNEYFEKLQKVRKGEKGGESGLITDVLGLRIICPFLEDLDIIEGLITEHFQIVEAQRKGAQNSFREFGYDSTHMLIRLKVWPVEEPIPHTENVCEIQLRTILQDAWAEVEHELVYKSDIALPNESIKRKLASLNATLTLSDLIFQEIRDYQKEIRHRGRKRRESLEETLLVQNRIALSQQTEWSPSSTGETGPLPNPLASKLERTMLSALNAHSRNDLQTAIALYGELLEMPLEKRIRAMVFNHRGMAHFSLGEFPRASRDFSQSILYDGENFRSWANRGLVNRMLRNFDCSVEDYSRALEIDPSNYEGYFGRAQTYYEMKLFSPALADCEQTLTFEPGFSPAEDLMRLIRRGSFSPG
jgi:putative GTP pyrophosphokinase